MLKNYLSLTAALLVSFSLSTQTLANDNNSAEKSPPEEQLPLRELRIFTQVFEQIRRGYVEEVKDTELLENAIAGLLLELDPHSAYSKRIGLRRTSGIRHWRIWRTGYGGGCRARHDQNHLAYRRHTCGKGWY